MKASKLLLVFYLVCVTALPVAAQNKFKGQNGGFQCATGCLKTTVPVVSQPLSSEETAWIVYMREEEKLALDVYQVLYAKWNLRIFDNIAASEQRHFDSIGALLQRYGIADPAQARGVFVNQDLQKLYDDLIAKGELTVINALQVGVTIEKEDIEDLEAALKATDNTDIKVVYTNLLAGSLKHLNAFESHLELLGIQ